MPEVYLLKQETLFLNKIKLLLSLYVLETAVYFIKNKTNLYT